MISNPELLADDLLTRWLVENSPVKIPFYNAWIWQSVAGKSLQYARTPQLQEAAIVTDCSVVEDPEQRVSQADFSYFEFVARYQICSVNLDRFAYPNNLDRVLYALAKRRILYAYAARLGDDALGLPSVADPARVIDLSAGALTLDCLDDAYERVTAGTGRPTLIMSHSRSLRTYRSLCRAAGFRPERVTCKWYDPTGRRMTRGSVDAFNDLRQRSALASKRLLCKPVARQRHAEPGR